MNILSFLDDSNEFIKNCPNHNVDDSDNMDTTKRYDVVVYDVLSLVAYEDAKDSMLNKEAFKISILSDMDELVVFKNFRTDGWILEDRFSDLEAFLDKVASKV